MNLQKNQKYITENMFPKVKVTSIRYREYCYKVQKTCHRINLYVNLWTRNKLGIGRCLLPPHLDRSSGKILSSVLAFIK